MTRRLRVFINGFGRIGRTIARQILCGPGHPPIDIVGINDIAPLETSAYLLRYDSVYGVFPLPFEVQACGLLIKGRVITVTRTPDLRTLDLRDVDVVLECTGMAGARGFAEAGLAAGAAKVLISGPSSAAEQTIVIGANEQDLREARIVSNASCTTNAIAPLLRTLDLGIGIKRAHVTTVHCYTGSQPTVDQPNGSLERSRAAAVSMVPTTTSAAAQIGIVLPEFDGRLTVSSLRVPCLSVSAIDAVIQLMEDPDESFQAFLRAAFAGSPLVGLCEDPCVSSDFRGRTESLVIALPETRSIGHRQLRILGWYDNEAGFSARMLEVAKLMASLGT